MDMENIKLRADIIDGIVRTSIVAKNGEYDPKANPEFDKFDIRWAAAMALSLYIDKNPELIKMMNLVQTA